MSVAAQLLRQARRADQLSQRALADRAGSPQPRIAEIEGERHDPKVATLDRFVRATGHQLALLPTRSPTAATCADDITVTLRTLGTTGRGEERSFRILIGFSDGLMGEPGPTRVALCVTSPPSTGDHRFDAAIAAIAEHHLSRDGLPIPDWVHEPNRGLDPPWIPDPYADPDIETQSPPAFRRHGVLLAESELASV